MAALAFGAAQAIESQAIGIVAPLPAQVSQVFMCGEWSTSEGTGRYRIVLADVSSGAGTEVYVQRIQGSEHPRVLETTPLRALNDDHAQYLVASATCAGRGSRSTVELVASFEHDEGDVEHRIRVSLSAPGVYRVRDRVVRVRPTRAVQ